LVALITAPGGCSSLERILSPDEHRRAEQFHTVTLRDSFVASRAALRAALGGCLRICPSRVALAYGSHGKPCVPGQRLRFNLSHSGDRALIALALESEVGVDLEQIRPIAERDDIASRYFSLEERRDLLSLAPRERDRAFFTCWTRKEAYVKAAAAGLSLALNSFRVTVLPPEMPRLFTPGDPRTWSLYDVAWTRDFAAALVCEGTPAMIQGWAFSGADACADYFAGQT
jgi:4'-phosphopantetheinyl transferase